MKLRFTICALAMLAVACSAPGWALTISDPGQGPVTLTGPSGGGLSGITFRSGNQYLTVADSAGAMFSSTIDIDLSTGLITGTPTIGTSVTLAGGVDVESVAFDPTNNTVIISDETGPAVRRHLLDGSLDSSIALPSVFSTPGNIRTNFGLESISRRSNGDIWTANEEALNGDGPISTTSAGTAIRLANLNTAQQWAYITDPIRGVFFGAQRSGVSDIQVLPDGTVLVLEREFSGTFRHRIYQVDFAGASDVSSITQLDPNVAPWTAVGKTLLWEGIFADINFEGLTLGPQLNNGDHTLLLVSDDDNSLPQAVHVLHLVGPIPEPTTATLLAIGCGLGVIKRRR